MDLITFLANRIEDAIEDRELQKHEPKRSLEDNVAGLMRYYKPEKGIISSVWQGRKSEYHSIMLRFFKEEEKLLIEQAVMLEDASLTSQRKKVEFQTFIADHATLFIKFKAQAELIELAASRGLDLDTYLTIQREQSLSEIRINEYQQTTGLAYLQEIEREKALAQIKVYLHKEISRTDLDNDIHNAEQTIRLALLSNALAEHQKINVLQNAIDLLYDQIEEIEKSNLSDRVKRFKIDDRMEIINTYKGDRRARQNRLF